MSNNKPPGEDFAKTYWRHSPTVESAIGALSAPERDFAELRLLSDNLPTLCWIADGDGAIGWYNRRWHDYCGSSPAEMDGWGWQSVHDPKILPDVMQEWAACIASGAAFEMTFPLRGGDGIFRTFLTRATPLKDRDGRVVRWFGTNTDISAQEKIGAALGESEAYVRLLLNSSAEAFYAIDRDGVTTLCNTTFLTMMGFDSENDVMGRKLHALIHHSHPNGSHYDVDDCPIYRCAAQGIEAHVSNEFFFPIGKPPLAVEYWAKPIIVDGEHTGAICTFLDITKRKAAEAQLRELADNIDQFAWTADPSGSIYWYNKRWFDYTGTTLDEMQGWGWRKVHHPDHVDRVVAKISRCFETGEQWEDTFPLRSASGEYRWFLSRALPIRNAMGEIERWFGTNTDVTGQLAAEEELRDLNATLESRVAQAAAEHEKTEERLRQSQKIEAVGQLTGGVAHDFNNLLTIIKSSTDLLRRPGVSEDRRTRYIEAISDTVDRAAKLTGQLLAFARRQALRPEVFDAGKSVRGIAEMINTLSGARIQVTVRVPELPVYIKADMSQFDTALVNMAVNARDAMNGEGELIIAVRAVSQVPQIRAHPARRGDFIAVSLKDTGSGISPDQIEQIFEPFFTTKGVGQGTGLGLSQVFGFAKQSEGEVLVESEVGNGSTFTLYVPSARPDEATATHFIDPGDLKDGAGVCVLVVEDNRDVGIFSTSTLEELGYSTLWVTNADEALTELGKNSSAFDVVFSDVVMPGMNGVELAREIHRRFPGLPVVLTSGYSDVLAQEGSHGFELLQKPYSVEALARILQTAIAHGKTLAARADARAEE